MNYRQLTPEERYMLAALRRQGLNQLEIARSPGRHRSTVCREVKRNSTRAGRHYCAFIARSAPTGAAPARSATAASRPGASP